MGMFNDRRCLFYLMTILCFQAALWIGCGKIEVSEPLSLGPDSAEPAPNPGALAGEPVAADSSSGQIDSENHSQLKLFTVKGVVKSIEPDLSRARIEHEEIPNYMEQMTMPCHIGDTNEWASVPAGDEITFLLHVTEDRSWIDGVEKNESHVPALDELPKTAPWRQVREVQPLEIGDLLPNYPLTNQFSKPI